MAKSEAPGGPKAEATAPVCAKCGASSFTTFRQPLAGSNGFFVYCAKCGAVVSWSLDPRVALGR